MKLKIAGGCGEHGRNCFLVQTDSLSFLVDCGIMAEEKENGYPHLTDEDIRQLRYVFLTHSHADHSGALPWLKRHGFSGTVIASCETFRQLPFEVSLKEELEKMCDRNNRASLYGVTLEYGCSGHCSGSVWYHFFCEEKSILFSGDYTENTQLYLFDAIRGHKADLAVLDCAYGSDTTSYKEYCQDLLSRVAWTKSKYKTVIFPVPKYGRGLELLKLLQGYFPKYRFAGDAHFIRQVMIIPEQNRWIKDYRTEVGCINDSPTADIIFISDPQLRSEESQKLALGILKNDGSSIMTGTVEAGTLSDRLINESEMFSQRYPVHLNISQYEELKKQNNFTLTIPYHTKEFDVPREISID